LHGDTKEEGRATAREFAPPGILELFEERLPAMAAEMEEGRADLSDGMALYHMTLEGMVLSAGQRAILTELEDGVLPGVRQGVYHVELDERWHIGFGLRCLIDARPSREFIDRILAEAEDSAAAWGDALPAEIRDMIVPMARRRMAIVVKQLDRLAAA
jgi:ribonucleoside-diphosphate reductase beta chain